VTDDQIAFVERGCGCVFEVDPPIAITQCPEHYAQSTEVERELGKRLGYELDELVTAACQGRKLERIRPVDHTKR